MALIDGLKCILFNENVIYIFDRDDDKSKVPEELLQRGNRLSARVESTMLQIERESGDWKKFNDSVNIYYKEFSDELLGFHFYTRLCDDHKGKLIGQWFDNKEKFLDWLSGCYVVPKYDLDRAHLLTMNDKIIGKFNFSMTL